jgi:hypothetical protein
MLQWTHNTAMIQSYQYKQKRDMSASQLLINIRWRPLNCDEGNTVLGELVCKDSAENGSCSDVQKLKTSLRFCKRLNIFLSDGMRHFILLTLAKQKLHCHVKVFFIFTNGCTIYFRRSTLKFTLKFTLKLLLHVSQGAYY